MVIKLYFKALEIQELVSKSEIVMKVVVPDLNSSFVKFLLHPVIALLNTKYISFTVCNLTNVC